MINRTPIAALFTDDYSPGNTGVLVSQIVGEVEDVDSKRFTGQAKQPNRPDWSVQKIRVREGNNVITVKVWGRPDLSPLKGITVGITATKQTKGTMAGKYTGLTLKEDNHKDPYNKSGQWVRILEVAERADFCVVGVDGQDVQLDDFLKVAQRGMPQQNQADQQPTGPREPGQPPQYAPPTQVETPNPPQFEQSQPAQPEQQQYTGPTWSRALREYAKIGRALEAAYVTTINSVKPHIEARTGYSLPSESIQAASTTLFIEFMRKHGLQEIPETDIPQPKTHPKALD